LGDDTVSHTAFVAAKRPKICKSIDCSIFELNYDVAGARCIVGQAINYIVRVTPRGRSHARFGWEICRSDNSLIVERSTGTFSTRTRALVASAKAASSIAFPLTVNPAYALKRIRPADKSERALV
jgi:hypothetical protein